MMSQSTFREQVVSVGAARCRFSDIGTVRQGEMFFGVPADDGSESFYIFDYPPDQLLEKRLNQLENKVKQLRETNQQLKERSLTDPLTGLRNRLYLEEFLGFDIARVHEDYVQWQDKGSAGSAGSGLAPEESNLCFLLVDMDYFKSVNDIYGHAAGDRVLAQMGEILPSVCRETDVVMRWGGEEFLVVSRFCGRGESEVLAERIRDAVHGHAFELGDGETIGLSCSVGLAEYPFIPTLESYRELDWRQVLSIADLALYSAKNAGCDAWVRLFSTARTDVENLYSRIRESMGHLVETGELGMHRAELGPLGLPLRRELEVLPKTSEN